MLIRPYAVSVVVLPGVSRTRTILPMAARPDQWCLSCNQQISVETVTVRVSMQP